MALRNPRLSALSSIIASDSGTSALKKDSECHSSRESCWKSWALSTCRWYRWPLGCPFKDSLSNERWPITITQMRNIEARFWLMYIVFMVHELALSFVCQSSQTFLSTSKDVFFVASLPLPFPISYIATMCMSPSIQFSFHQRPLLIQLYNASTQRIPHPTLERKTNVERFFFRVPAVTIVKGETLVEMTDRPTPCYAMQKSNMRPSSHHNAPTTIKPTAPNMAPNPTSILLDPPVCKLPPLPLVVAGPDPPVV